VVRVVHVLLLKKQKRLHIDAKPPHREDRALAWLEPVQELLPVHVLFVEKGNDARLAVVGRLLWRGWFLLLRGEGVSVDLCIGFGLVSADEFVARGFDIGVFATFVACVEVGLGFV
jgi:hypothetical protein